MMRIKDKRQITDSAVILFGLVFLLARARYGYCFDDEPYIISLAQRFYFGDSLIVHDWSGLQNVGILLLPLFKLYHCFSMNNVGILLFFRYAYCVAWFLTCCVLYFVFRYNNKREAILVFGYQIFFSPLDYMTMSYTSISLMAALLIASLFYSNFEIAKMKPWKFSILFSFLSCIFVMCYPFIAGYYSIAFICVLLLGLFNPFKWRKETVKWWLRVCLISAGIITSAVVVYLYFFALNNNTIDNILRSAIFMANIPGYQKGPFEVIPRDLKVLYEYCPGFILLIAFGLFFAIAAPKNSMHKKLKIPVFLTACALYIFAQFSVCIDYHPVLHNTMNFQMLGFSLLGILAYVLLENKPKSLFLCFVPLSLIYSHCVSMSSNTVLLAISMALSVAGTAGVVFVVQLGRELFAHEKQLIKKMVSISVSMVLVMQIGSELFLKCTRFYWDKPVYKLRFEISEGAAKGLLTSWENRQDYEETYEALSFLLAKCNEESNINSLKENRFLSLIMMPVVYLDAGLPYATYSAWMNDFIPEVLLDYYSINPDKTPSIIFTNKENEYKFDLCFNRDNYKQYEFEKYKLFVVR